MTSSERLKTRHAGLIRTLHGEIRRYPGGYQEIARQLGRNAQSLINMFNPNSMEQGPTVDVLLDVIELISARATVGVIAGTVDMRLVPIEDHTPEAGTDAAAFGRLTGEVGDVLQCGARALADGRLDADERKQLRIELSDLVSAAEAMLRRLDR